MRTSRPRRSAASAPAPAPSNAIKSTDVPKAIPDNNPAGVTSTINVTNPGTVNHLTVSIDSLTHTYDGDLKMELIAPDGTDVVLVNRTGGGNDSGDNFTNTLFDDGAAQSIYSGPAPYSGSFRPDQALSAFDGKQQQGTWTLKVSDLSALDKGTLNGWSLTPSQPTSATPAGTPIVRSSTDVPKSIPDNSTTGVTSTISVPDAGTLASLTVTVGQLTHTWDGDLKIELIGPDGTDVVLADRPGTINNGADNFTNTVFDDTSAVNLTDGASPYSGTYRPQVGALSAFAGKPIKGTWTLKVSDLSPGDTGSLGSWKLSLVPAVCG